MDIRAEQLSRRTTDPLTRRDHLMHTDIQDVCENRSSQESALKNICGYPQINVTSGNRQHDRHNAVSDCYTPASRAAAAAQTQMPLEDGTDGPGDGGYGPPGGE
jgi:hypothetical protein